MDACRGPGRVPVSNFCEGRPTVARKVLGDHGEQIFRVYCSPIDEQFHCN